MKSFELKAKLKSLMMNCLRDFMLQLTCIAVLFATFLLTMSGSSLTETGLFVGSTWCMGYLYSKIQLNWDVIWMIMPRLLKM